MILKHLLQRYSDNGNDTLGLLFLDDKFFSHALEDENRPVKVQGETRIDAGIYPLALRMEATPLTLEYRRRFPWFTWHVEILNLPRHKNVYLHVGNKEKDSDACVLLGDSANNNTIAHGFIGASAIAFERWYKRVMPHLKNGGQASIEIRDENRLR